MAEESAKTDVIEDTATAAARVSYQEKRWPGWLAPAVGGAIFLALAPLGATLGLGAVTTLTVALFYVVVAQGWNLLGGFAGYINFGVALFTGAGVYTAALLNSNAGWGMWATIIPAALVAMAVSAVVGVATLRLRSHYFSIFTLILVFLVIVIVNNSPALGGAIGLVTEVDGDWTSRGLAQFFYYSFFGLAIVATGIAYVVANSNLGNALRSVREDEAAARVLGVRTTDVKFRALLIGAALGGAAGAMFAFFTPYIEPAGTFDLAFSLDIVLVCVVGGLGTWIGPLIGGIIVVLLEQFLRNLILDVHPFGMDIPPDANRLVLGVVLIVFALFARRGIVGLVQRRRGRRIAV